MPAKKRSVTRPTTLEHFMKTLTTLRLSEDIYEDLIRTLDKLITDITRLSTKLARQERMKTVMPAHVEKATQEILRTGPLTVPELRDRIKPLTIIELSQLTEEVEKMAQELLKKRRSRR